MAYSDSFPAVRPVFQSDFANGGRIDPRITFSRSDTPPTYAAPSAVHYWSNEKHESSQNLVEYSSDISSSYWTKQGVSPTGGQTAPDGGTDAYKLTEDAATSDHRIYHTFGATPTDETTITFFVKYIGRQWIYVRAKDVGGTNRYCWFDIQNGLVGTVQTNVTASIASSGNGYYKCTVVLASAIASGQSLNIGGAAADGDGAGYAGLNGDAFSIWGINMSTLGETVLNETSGQIHREYAPTLKSVSTAGQPRFEYSPTDSASEAMGSSRGLLIEGQVTNINTYSKGGVNGSGVVRWQVDNGSATGNSAVGPDGTLSALHFVPNTTTTAHYAYNNAGSAPSGSTPHTISVYAKAAGYSDIVIRLTSSYSAFANTINATFTLTGDGSVSVTGGTATAAIESCGNGWYRCQVTETTSSSPTGMRPYIYAKQVASYAGDGFSGVLLWGWQVEANSFASSFVDTGTSGSTATRAADSASAVTADIGYTGGAFSLGADFRLNGKNSTGNGVAAVKDASSNSLILRVASDNLGAFADVAGATTINATIEAGVTSGTDYSVFARWDTNDYRGASNGTLGNTDTVCPLPAFNSPALHIGGYLTNYELNGHIKRIALYGEALSDTNLQALTS